MRRLQYAGEYFSFNGRGQEVPHIPTFGDYAVNGSNIGVGITVPVHVVLPENNFAAASGLDAK